MPPYEGRVSPVWRATIGRPKWLLSDVDAKRQQELPRKRVREHARQRTFCKAGKFIRLSHPRFWRGVSQNKCCLFSCALSPCRSRATPLPEGGLLPTVDKIKFLAGGRGDPSPTVLDFAGTVGDRVVASTEPDLCWESADAEVDQEHGDVRGADAADTGRLPYGQGLSGVQFLHRLNPKTGDLGIVKVVWQRL